MASTGHRRSSSALAGATLLALGCWFAGCALLSSDAFVSGPAARTEHARRTSLRAEAAASPSPSPSVALVKVTEENKMTTASVLGGLAGLLVGGVWVGAGLFAAGSYLTRKDDDIAKALKGVASGSLEVLNFGGYLNDKYTVTDKIGSAFNEALESTSSGSSSTDSVSGFVTGVVDAVKTADKDIGFKDTLGQLASSASDLAYQAVEKAVDLNAQYKITDQIKEKIDEATSGAQAASSSSTKTA